MIHILNIYLNINTNYITYDNTYSITFSINYIHTVLDCVRCYVHILVLDI